MTPAITAFDHVLVGVADLEGARATWQRLGFTVCPRGRHIGWGTANYCLMFEQDYVELLGIVDPAQFTNNLDRFLEERGEGLLAAAYRSDDIDATANAFRARGLAVDGPRDLARIIEHPEGELQPRFRLVHLDPASRPGLLAFVCQHLTAEMVWQPAWTWHANTARRIKRLVAVAEDLGAAALAGAAWFGESGVQAADGSVFMKAGEFQLELLTPQAAAKRYGSRLPWGPRPGPLGFTVGVQDLDACDAVLEAGGIARQKVDGVVRVPYSQANGVLLEFEQA